MTPQMVVQTQPVTWSQSLGYSWEISPFIFNLCNNPNIKPMFCKYFIYLQSHCTPKKIQCLDKVNYYITRLLKLIHKMCNKDNVSILTLGIMQNHDNQLPIQAQWVDHLFKVN
jgi:hypothetical protein